MYMRIGLTARALVVCLAAVLAGAWASGAAQTPAPAKTQTASQFYVSYRQAFDKAKKIDDLLPYMADKNRKQVAATAAADREQMFSMMKAMGALTDLKVLKEDRQPDGSAVLTCEGMDGDRKKSTGKVTIVKEGGAWKLGDESWSS
jgi:hypothetical protein